MTKKHIKDIDQHMIPRVGEKGNLTDDPDHQGTDDPNRDEIGWER